ARQISRPCMAHCAGPYRLRTWSLVFLHAPAVYVDSARRQRFRSWRVYCAGRLVARADARVSSSGESETPGGSSPRAVFHARCFLLAERVVSGADFSFLEAPP